MKSSGLIDRVVILIHLKKFHTGVIHNGISDHSLIYAIRKIKVFQKTDDCVEIRNMKNFNESLLKNFLISNFGNPYTSFTRIRTLCGNYGKSFFLEILNKYAPLQHKKINCNKGPWITNKIKELITTRDI